MSIRLTIRKMNKKREITKYNLDEFSEDLYELDFTYIDQLSQEQWGIKELFLDGDGYGYFSMSKETLMEFLNNYQQRLLQYYSEINEQLKKSDYKKVETLIKVRIALLSNKMFINDDVENNILTSSYLIEHSIFNLVHILKTVNFKTENLFLYLS